ncbi:MAG: ECF-type sigma factor [Thermoanaerobaculia bacterium]|nr:ECF-type sigma factor [Thermoanaerobaculia bacterium]
MNEAEPITLLANRWATFQAEDRVAGDLLFELVYDRLHSIASAQLARYPQDAVIQTTVVLNEAFLKIARSSGVRWHDREHFFSYCARVMRHVLVDLAKIRRASKRGAGTTLLSLERAPDPAETPQTEDILTVHRALLALEEIDPERARIVELRFFGGMEPREISRTLGLSESTVHRRWRTARAWLFSFVQGKKALPFSSPAGGKD